MSTTYHRIIRKLVVGFGSLFDNITLTRYNADGTEDRKIKVPIIYSPKEKYVARLLGDPDLNKKVQITLPRMSFDLLSMSYDASRKQITNQKIVADSSASNKRTTLYNPVPYNFEFSLYIYVRNIEDGTQIIEHILPFFTPEYTIKLNLVPTMGIVKEVPMTLNSVDHSVEYEGLQDSDARVIIWTLNFTAKGFVYGSSSEGKIIKSANTNILNLDYFEKNNRVVFNLAPTGFGKFKNGEIVYQGYSFDTAKATGSVVSYSNNTNRLIVTDINGAFKTNTEIIGLDSFAEYNLISFDSANANSKMVNIHSYVNPANATSNSTYTIQTNITSTTVTKFEKNMSDIFEVNSTVSDSAVVVREEKPVVEIDSKLDDDLEKDYKKVRQNYEEIIEKGVDAIDSILEIARESEHPRAFEVAATMIKNVADANEKLIMLQKQMREMNKAAGKETQSTKIDKAIFVGSTADLNKMLKGKE